MRMNLSVSLEFGHGCTFIGNGGKAMSDWSDGAVRRSRNRIEANANKNAKALQDKGVLDGEGMELWSQLKATIGRMCEDFNSDRNRTTSLNFKEDQSEFTLSCANNPGVIAGKYSGITFSFVGKNGINYNSTIIVKLTNDGLGVWPASAKGEPVTIEDYASELIELVLIAAGR